VTERVRIFSSSTYEVEVALAPRNSKAAALVEAKGSIVAVQHVQPQQTGAVAVQALHAPEQLASNASAPPCLVHAQRQDVCNRSRDHGPAKLRCQQSFVLLRAHSPAYKANQSLARLCHEPADAVRTLHDLGEPAALVAARALALTCKRLHAHAHDGQARVVERLQLLLIAFRDWAV